MNMQKLPILKPGDTVELIAPASRVTPTRLRALQELLDTWGLHYHLPANLLGDDLLCANSDANRFTLLKNAIYKPDTQAIICVCGGYGSMRLIPMLSGVPRPATRKLFVGMSDTTALQLFLQNHWHWPSIHGVPAPDRFSAESIAAIKALMFGEKENVTYHVQPLNDPATQTNSIKTTLTGGNLCLIQNSIGTLWQIDATNKIIFLEEIGERAYRVDRMLEHLRQANVFARAQALIFGDFLEGDEPNGECLLAPVLKRFAESCDFPVMQIPHIGHGRINFPLPLGTAAHLECGQRPYLRCEC